MTYRIDPINVPSTAPYTNDALNRKSTVDFIANIIQSASGPFVLAIDSPWGTGKTTLTRMLKAELESKKYQCVYFNAWEVDYITDPLVAMVSAIDDIKSLDADVWDKLKGGMETVRKVTTAVAKRGVVAATKAATMGALDLEKDMEKIVADFSGEVAKDAVESFQKQVKLLSTMRTSLEDVIAKLPEAGKQPKLVFFVDELDRCRPNFAIEVLERIKHVFDIENMIFVLSIDKSQLEASTAAVYGDQINAPEYLRRFLDLEFGIPQMGGEPYTLALLNRFELDNWFAARQGELAYDKENFVKFFSLLADACKMTLRARERAIARLRVVLDQTRSNQYLDPILVAVMILLRTLEPKLFMRAASGEASSVQVMEYLRSLPGDKSFLEERLGFLLEAILISSDQPHAREVRVSDLKSILSDPDATSYAKDRAQEILNIVSRFIQPFGLTHAFRNVAAKIDLAARINV